MAHAKDALIKPEWFVLFTGIVAAFHVGKLAPAIPALQAQLNISLFEGGLLLSLVQLVGMLSGVFWGAMIGSIGLRRSVLTGLTVLSASSFIGGFSDSAALLLVLRAFEGLGFVLVALSGPGLMRATVPQHRLNISIGWWGTFMGFGTALAMIAGPFLIQSLGWQAWWWASSLMTVTLLLWARLKLSVELDAHATLVINNSFIVNLFKNLREVLKRKDPWFLAIMFAAYSGQWLSVVGFLPSIYEQAGISGGLIALLSATVALANALGNILGGRLLHWGVAPGVLLSLIFGMSALTTFVTFAELFEGQLMLQFCAVFLFSALGGVIPAVLFALAVERAPEPHLIPATVGWVQQLSALGQAATPPLIAWIAAATGSWSYTWWVTGALSLVGILFAVFGILRRQA